MSELLHIVQRDEELSTAAASASRTQVEADRDVIAARQAAEDLERQVWQREEIERRVLAATRQLEQSQNTEFTAHTEQLAAQLEEIESRRQAQERQHQQVIAALRSECTDTRTSIEATRAALEQLNIDLNRGRAELGPAQQALIASRIRLNHREEEYRTLSAALAIRQEVLENYLTRLRPR